jgi:hypothetical protein
MYVNPLSIQSTTPPCWMAAPADPPLSPVPLPQLTHTRASVHQSSPPTLDLVPCCAVKRCSRAMRGTFWLASVSQFSADGATLVVGETWAGRATRWNATSGAYLGIAGTFSYPTGVVQCGARDAAGVVATEVLADRLGEWIVIVHAVLCKGRFGIYDAFLIFTSACLSEIEYYCVSSVLYT